MVVGISGAQMSRVKEIESAIETLSSQELEELQDWLQAHLGPQPIDERIAADAAAGKLDKAVERVLGDIKGGRVKPL